MVRNELVKIFLKEVIREIWYLIRVLKEVVGESSVKNNMNFLGESD